MPLPAALLARLQKRGLITEVEEEKDETEEVFAEDYDDQAHNDQSEQAMQLANQNILSILIYESLACPNKVNPHHDCVEFCKKNYGLKVFKVDDKMESRRLRMLRKYPLPVGWHEVGDPETGRFYYWNAETDKVSWLSPTHPKAKITMCAEKLQALMKGKENTVQKKTKFSDLPSLEEAEEEDKRDRKRPRRDRKREKDALDPMDPASYSDISRGGWSAGLERGGEAKTGVDTTATGPLFQQRPYPSPGAILRANKPPPKD